MKKIFMTFLTSCSLYAYNSGINIGGSDLDIIKGSGKMVSKTFKLEDFNKVKVDASIKIVIKKSLNLGYTITADDNLIHLIHVEKRGNNLVISSEKSYQTDNTITLVLKVKQLNSLIVDAAADIELKSLDEDNLIIDLDGAVDLKATVGNIGHLTVKVDGAYDVDLTQLNVKIAKVKMKGSGDLSINVSKRLNAKVSDNASLSYFGTAVLVKKISDNGEINKN